ncbi:hypothetical protein [Streptomyces lavendulae]|uniref:hypothetical protein n=1 Tax=Streptomyces lavendulae TaxID=1914 RepID=UPI0031EA76A0
MEGRSPGAIVVREPTLVAFLCKVYDNVWAGAAPFTPGEEDAAEALLRLGEHRQAERFVVEQLATSGVRSPRVRGVSLRLRAATSELRQRPKLLARAVDELSRSGDRLELAKALADLGRALLLPGEGTRAGMVTRRAWHLAAD